MLLDNSLGNGNIASYSITNNSENNHFIARRNALMNSIEALKNPDIHTEIDGYSYDITKHEPIRDFISKILSHPLVTALIFVAKKNPGVDGKIIDEWHQKTKILSKTTDSMRSGFTQYMQSLKLNMNFAELKKVELHLPKTLPDKIADIISQEPEMSLTHMKPKIIRIYNKLQSTISSLNESISFATQCLEYWNGKYPTRFPITDCTKTIKIDEKNSNIAHISIKNTEGEVIAIFSTDSNTKTFHTVLNEEFINNDTDSIEEKLPISETYIFQ